MGTVLKKVQCPDCAIMGGDKSKDNKVIYTDNSSYCFSCGATEASNMIESKPVTPLMQGDIIELVERKISRKICEKFNVRVGKDYQGNDCVIYPIYHNGREVKQKVRNRFDKKQQRTLGDTKVKELFGSHIFQPSKSIPIVIVEGENDMLALHQMTGYPVVSIVSGAGGAKRELEANMEWLSEWKSVSICFDNDEAGEKATEECVGLFEPGQVRVVTFPLKDANDMLMEGRDEEAKKCLFNATIIKPSTLVMPSEILGKVLERPRMGADWPWKTFTKATYGCRWGELYLLAGPTSCGKTEICSAIIRKMIYNNIHVGVFSLEQSPADTIRRFIGGTINKRLHLPGSEGWDEAYITEQVADLDSKMALYDRGSGMITLEQVLINIRYLNKCKGTKFFVIDNLRAMSMRPIVDGKSVPDFIYMTYVMDCLSSLCKELEVTIFVLAHVGNHTVSVSAKVTADDGDWNAAKAVNREGTSWESGRMSSLETIYGGTRISNLCDYVIAIARNRISEDDLIHRTIRLKFLKTRLDSYYEGKEMRLVYDYETGQLAEEFDQLS